MWKLLFWLLLIGGLVYFASSFWHSQSTTERIEDKAGRIVEGLYTSADSAIRVAYREAKEQELDSLDDALKRLWQNVPAKQDSTYAAWNRTLEQVIMRKNALNDKLLHLDTVAAERYEQARNKIEVGIRMLQEEMRRFEEKP
jgi:hypothetical protein